MAGGGPVVFARTLIELQTRPKTTSPFVAAKNQMTYRFRRQDYPFSSYADDGFGRISVTIGGDATPVFTVGASFFMAGNITPQDVTVLSATYTGGGTNHTVIVFNEAADPTYFGLSGYLNNNSFLNYRLSVSIYNYDTNALVFSSLEVSPFYDSTTGDTILYVDVSGVIQNNLSPNNEWADVSNPYNAGYGSLASALDTNFIRFYIKWTELWTGSSETQVIDSGTGGRVIGVLGKADVTMTNDYDKFMMPTTAGGSGYWLTKLARPKMWNGFPFSLSCVIGAQSGTTQLIATFKDSLGSAVYTGTIGLTSSWANYSILRVFPEAIYKLGNAGAEIPSTVVTIDLKFRTNSIDSQIITIDMVDTSIQQNTLVLYFRNSMGGDVFYGFTYNQEQSYFFQANTKNKRLNLFAENLTADEWEAIQDSTTLGEIYKANYITWATSINKYQKRTDQQLFIYGLPRPLTGTGTSNYTSIGCIMIPTEGVTETKRRGHRIQLTVELPEAP